jgi:hypothetical protein
VTPTVFIVGDVSDRYHPLVAVRGDFTVVAVSFATGDFSCIATAGDTGLHDCRPDDVPR